MIFEHERMGMGAEDYCTCGLIWPCMDALTTALNRLGRKAHD